MSKEFEFLNKSHPDMVDVWRYDQDERSLEGFKTARTILANRLGVAASFGFFDEDVRLHLQSSYQQRLDQPSRTNSGVGSPFVSGMLQPSRLVENWIRRHPDSIKTSLYRVAVPRNRLIVPTQGNDLSLPDRQKNSLEVLVVGDIDRESIKETKSVEWQNLV
jgi:hypothetical protein